MKWKKAKEKNAKKPKDKYSNSYIAFICHVNDGL